MLWWDPHAARGLGWGSAGAISGPQRYFWEGGTSSAREGEYRGVAHSYDHLCPGSAWLVQGYIHCSVVGEIC